MVVASREARKASNKEKYGVHYDAQYNSGYSLGSSLLVDLLAYVLGEGHRGFGPLLRKVQDQLEYAEDWRLQHACAAKKVVLLRPSGLRKQTLGSLKVLAE